ncbi:hypothetical protein VT84_18220 [Gemmata sp. SH-PL17]|uniref:Uncharacterized protein n=1 Tax=Gemmata massiliana TaxID=1210884 RepID=A0A6P2D544_9BACT|nr:hypothetical protein [Gemmata massiliana]AMV26339.1 hypothetical protein VT84_18220 [Gemmata sp. SH-PL17]VTR95606.1 unnamed protein product [Gemmata massiliana]
MQADSIDRNDLYRLADDGCPHSPTSDTSAHDLSALWIALGKDDRRAE